MQFTAKTGINANPRTNCLVLGIYNNNKLSSAATLTDEIANGAIRRILRKGDFKATCGETQLCYDIPGVAASRVLLLGLGKKSDLTSKQLAAAINKAARQLNANNAADMTFSLPQHMDEKSTAYQAARDIALAVADAQYKPDHCKSENSAPKKPLKKLTLQVASKKIQNVVERGFNHGEAISSGMKVTRTLADLPGNICTPTYLADTARKLAKKSAKLKVSVLSEKQMERLGMGALLSVSRGSREPAQLIVMEYQGARKDKAPVALVGKGLTFDAGGISIKPSASMDEMKYDMCGGASVIGTIAACEEMKLPINVVGVVPASENLPDGAANKPGDIVTSMAGKTIEVLNTDAEGRLILCDALTFVGKYKPEIVIDVATLTGACVVALGQHATGLMSNNEKLAEELLSAGEETGDRAWRLPLWDDYQSQLDSNFADIANIGGRWGGAITAGCFLSRFTEDYKWAHLDIAGVAWKQGADKGSTGRPVTLLSHMLIKRAKQSL
ncbi:MAG: leucyl aminopeptidase [bacterium]